MHLKKKILRSAETVLFPDVIDYHKQKQHKVASNYQSSTHMYVMIQSSALGTYSHMIPLGMALNH